MKIAIGNGIGYSSNRYNKGGFDPDYQAVLDYMNTQGYTLPSSSTQNEQNTLVKDLKSAGIWSKLDSFAVFATDGDSDSALVDWKRLITMTAVNAPTFTSLEGFTGDGVSAYINNDFTPSTDGVNYQQTNASFGNYWRSFGTVDPCYLNGVRDAVQGRSDVVYTSTTVSYKIQNTATLTSAPALGLYSVNTLSGTQRIYRNGVLQDTDTSVEGALNITSFVDLARQDNGISIILPTNGQCSISYKAADLSAESGDFYNAIQTYMTSIGKAV